MSETQVMCDNTYHGYEDAGDAYRDVEEAISDVLMMDSEFSGTLTVVVTYTPTEGTS